MQPLGPHLKAQREEKGIRLEEIASITKIHVQTLEALEAGEWEKLPPEPFILGFITAYAKYVGLEPDDAVRLYRQEKGVETQRTEIVTPPAEDEEDASPEQVMEREQKPLGKQIGIALGVLALVGVGGALIYLGKKEDSILKGPTAAKQESSEISEEELTALLGEPEEDKKADSGKLPDPRDLASPPAHKIQIQGGERSWIKVVVDDKEPVEFFLNEDRKVSYEARDKIKVILGNASGSKVTYNGKENPGRRLGSGVQAFIFPKGAKFPQDKPKKSDDDALKGIENVKKSDS